MKIELSNTDIIFIYGQFQKQLAEIKKVESSSNCPFDKKTIADQKAPYLSVVQKLKEQMPELSKLDNHF